MLFSLLLVLVLFSNAQTLYFTNCVNPDGATHIASLGHDMFNNRPNVVLWIDAETSLLSLKNTENYEPSTMNIKYVFTLRDDTIFYISIEKEATITIIDTNVHLYGGWWLKVSKDDTCIVMQRFKEIRPSQEFMRINDFFIAEKEMMLTRILKYNNDFKLIEHYFRLGHWLYCSGKIDHPKRTMKKKMANIYTSRK